MGEAAPALAEVGLAHFVGRVGERFAAMPPGDGGGRTGQTFELAEAAPLAAETTPPGAFRAPFRLIFRGPREAYFPQGILALEHAELGRLEIFLVPIGPDELGMRYEAIFT
jgi:hypothetical protein